MNTIFRVAGKEFGAFFSSPVAFIFFGVFLAVTLFVFFWIETFFANNIAEVRPLFAWMPVLLIFLTAAVTMRLWAEERRAGTLELLLTSPVQPVSLVLGKFLGCLGLVVVSLALTLPIPITVSFMGALDWGPVFGGYLAAIFLAAAYIAIGLLVSVKSENQIVSLIITTLVCSLLYLVGSDALTGFFGNRGSEILKLLGSGSRFDSITRGVVDLRDLYYYLGIMGIFLSLNVYGLEKLRWAGNPLNKNHRLWQSVCGLLIANFLAANFWLAPIGSLRVDMTQGNMYSISEATRSYLSQLKEPLLIRGYFSAQTHPLLAPLVPRIRDLLEEYSIAGGGKVRVEVIDPLENPDLEQEAGQKYGIRPIPFQTSSKYQASVTNSYFDILIKYGDQFETLGFRDLIEVKMQSEEDIFVELRNPEYDITRAIKKTLYSYQGGGNLFTDIAKPITFTGYLSPDNQLPEQLVALKKDLLQLLADMQKNSGDLFMSSIVDPDGNGGHVAEQISMEYGFSPMAASLFDQQTFWFYMTMASGDQIVEIPLPQNLDKDSLQRSLEAGLKRFAVGFTKTVALHAPQSAPAMSQFGMADQGKQFNLLRELLAQEHSITDTDLQDGHVPEESDLLMVVSPESLDQKQLFAIDQFLMQGGTVILATSPFDIELGQNLAVKEHQSGLTEWLKFHGITIGEEMVLDPQNSAFPVPVQRNVGGFTIQETRMVNYPYFVDVRPDGMNQDGTLTAGLNQVTMNWSSPITIDSGPNQHRQVIRLLESSDKSWLSDQTNMQPDFTSYGDLGFRQADEQGRHLLGVVLEGKFTSYFKDKPSPLLFEGSVTEQEQEGVGADGGGESHDKELGQVITRMIEKSPESARIILFASNTFLDDTVLGIGSSVLRTSYLTPAQMMINAVDWSLEDRGLLQIRGRSHFSRLLVPMSKDVQIFWEYLNYSLALAGLFVVWMMKNLIMKRREKREQLLIEQSMGRI